MRYDIPNDSRNYKDEAIYDLIWYLNKNIDKEKDLGYSYTDLYQFDTTKLFTLFEDNQYFSTEAQIYNNGKSYIYDYILLENNKLLIIETESPETNIERTSLFYFLITNADKYIIETSRDQSGKINIEIKDQEGKKLHKFNETQYKETLEIPVKKRFNEILKPVSLEKLIEKGMKKKIKLRKMDKQ